MAFFMGRRVAAVFSGTLCLYQSNLLPSSHTLSKHLTSKFYLPVGIPQHSIRAIRSITTIPLPFALILLRET